MSGKRKPSPEFTLTSLSPLLLTDEDTDVGGGKNKDTLRSARLQRPQKQKAVLGVRSRTFDSSDCDESTSSASSETPLPPRPPGFSLTIGTTKKKKDDAPDIIKKTDPSAPSKQKPKKEPLPMKLRALPQSFWQQPNQTNCLSPGAVYPILPPLSSLGTTKDDVENIAAGMRSTASPEEGQAPRREVSVANTDLLFSLFRTVEDETPKVAVVLAMVSLKDGDKSVSLPSLNVEHNYSQILSELVIKL
ncbi:hypothetical protein C0J52_06937 [Blattella germanica]|nr:hypothetical protein C0J52_06937 [Blattella germanica]